MSTLSTDVAGSDVIQVTARDGTRTHYVSDLEMAAGPDRAPQALCGQTFHPAGLTVPPGRLCPLCAAVALASHNQPADE